MLKIELYSSKLVKPIIQDPSIEISGSEENVSLGLVNLNSHVFSAFLWVCLISVSKFLLKESNRSSV